jgi:hypothetical protein
MLETRSPVEVLTVVPTAARLLDEEAERLRRHAVSQANSGDWGPTQRYWALQDCASDLGALPAEIATEAARR